MKDLSRYFDHAATTPIHPAALAAMMPFLAEAWGNAHSLHAWGVRARDAVERAREQVATAIGASDPFQVVFTSGATEANNWVLRSCVDLRVSAIEHSSLRVPAQAWGMPQLSVRKWQVETQEGYDASVMAVNNETGGMPSLRVRPTRLHVDATQAVGKVDWKVGDSDWASCSAHKLGGPMGVGALYIRDGYLEPAVLGGGQEHGRRSGTLNVPGIVGFGAAAYEALAERDEASRRAETLREIVLNRLRNLADWQTNDAPNQSPHILSLSFLDLLGETLVIELDRAGFAISSGAACSSESEEESPVLRALGIDPAWNRGTVRVSFGRHNTAGSATDLADALATGVEKLRGLGRNP